MATQLTTTREERGQIIAQHNGQIKRFEEGFYTYNPKAETVNTPSQKLGISIEGENKWKTLIQNASRNGAL